MLNTAHIIGMVIILLGMTVVNFLSVRGVDSTADFILGNREAGAGLVTGMLLGTLIGGISIVGTVQLAYEFGLSGLGSTVGSSLGCIILGLFWAEDLRESKVETGPQFLIRVFGDKAGPLSILFNSIGTFINIAANVLAAVALLTSIFGLSSLWAGVLAGGLIVIYIIFGGVKGAGLVGIVKTVLIYLALLFSVIIISNTPGGIKALAAQLDFTSWYTLFERGVIDDLAAICSVVIGLLSTQTYLQAVFMSRDVKSGKKGAVIAGVLMLPVGVLGTIIGLYMRANYPQINSAQALPIFILNHFPPLFSGMVLSLLLLAIVISGAGLTLGVSTMLSQDIYGVLIRPEATSKERLLVLRIIIILIVSFSLCFVVMNLKSVIMEWSYLSLTLRGTSMFLPLFGAIFFKENITQKAGLLTVILSPLSSLLWAIFHPQGVDPLYIGLLVGGLILGSSLLSSEQNSAFQEKV